MSDIQKILVPDVGGEEVEIIEICFAVGDTLDADEGIVTVETDKASMDIPAPFAGELASLSVKVGDKIKEGDVIGEIKAASASAEAPAEEASAAPVAEAATPAIETPVEPAPVAAPLATAVSEVIEVAVPDIGEDGEVDVIDVLVAVGDVIEPEDGLITLETNKATMDVPSTHGGTVKEVFISSGDKVKQGTVVIKLETSSGAPIEAAIAAVAMGAVVIEKHITLDRKLEGPDHFASIEPQSFREMVDAIHNVSCALGSEDKTVTNSEKNNKIAARKSIVAKKHIKTGDFFTTENLIIKRPGSGISPMYWDEIIGRQSIKDFNKDDLIEW